MPELPEIPSKRTRKPWTGKIYNPRAIFEKEQAEKRVMTAADFAKFTKEGIEVRFQSIEASIKGMEAAFKEALTELAKELRAKK
jgi:hypothetical protein